MPDGSDPGRVERYTDRQVERVRQTVQEPNRSDILKTIRKGRRGNIPSPKPNQRTKPSWSKATVRNNARDLRILAGQLQGLEEMTYEGTKWKGREGRDDYPDRLLDLSPEKVTNLITELSIERDWARSNERDYCLTVRNHFLAHDKVEEATSIDYPQVGQENAAVDIETVPTRKDLLRLIDGENVRDKAMYTVLWESGCRVTALAALKVKHWTPRGDSYGIVQVPGAYVEGLKGAEHSLWKGTCDGACFALRFSLPSPAGLRQLIISGVDARRCCRSRRPVRTWTGRLLSSTHTPRFR